MELNLIVWFFWVMIENLVLLVELWELFLANNTVGEIMTTDVDVVNNRNLPFEDEACNLVTLVNVLHHLDDPDAALPEISRVLRSGGKFLVSDFTEAGFDILDRIHGEEGRVHKKNTEETVDTLVKKLGKFGRQCTSRDSRFHQNLMGELHLL